MGGPMAGGEQKFWGKIHTQIAKQVEPESFSLIWMDDKNSDTELDVDKTLLERQPVK